jgi:O-antigen/teichoic acid export membrane protein
MTAAEPVRQTSPWRPMVAAMWKTGGASIASAMASAMATKIVASVLGPGSIALLGTLQQLRDGAVTLATANGRTALVQGLSSLDGVARREYLRTVGLLFGGATLLVAIAICAAPSEIIRWSRLPDSSASMLTWLALTVVLLSAFVFLTGMVNAMGEIGKLALLQMASPLAALAVAWPMAASVRAGHPSAMILYLAIPGAAAITASAAALSRHREQLRGWFQGSGRWCTAGAARHFLAISAAMLASGLVANVVLLAVRGSMIRREGLGMTGQFDAAWNISMNHVTLILASVQTYYLPALSASKSATDRGRKIRRMLMVATLVTVPVIVCLAALKPLAVSVLYSRAFGTAPEFLRWTLLGDFLKVGSWVLATPMLAARDLSAFLIFDLLAHGTFFGSAVLLAGIVRPSEGAAMGFLISHTLYFALCYRHARKKYEFRLGARGRSAWVTGLALVAAVSADCWSDSAVHWARAAMWIALAIGFSGGFALYIRRREA